MFTIFQLLQFIIKFKKYITVFFFPPKNITRFINKIIIIINYYKLLKISSKVKTVNTHLQKIGHSIR